MKFIDDLKKKGHLVAYVGDVVGTGSSRKVRDQQRASGRPARTSRSCPTSASAASRSAARSRRSSSTRRRTPARCRSRSTSTAARHGRRDRHPSLRRQDREGRQGRRRRSGSRADVLFDEVRAGGRINLIIGRCAHRQGARGPRPARVAPCSACRSAAGQRQGLHAGAEDGRPRLRAAGRPGHPSRHLLRAEDDHGRPPGHHRPDDPRRAEGPRLPRLLRRPGDAVVLPHRRLPEAGGREDAPRAARVHQQPRRRVAAPGRRRHPQLAQPPAAARHRRHRRRQPHALPDRHLVPGGLRPRRLRAPPPA